MSKGRLRWWLWRNSSRLARTCPANAYTRLVMRDKDVSTQVDSICRSDLARNGACWCGKLRSTTGDTP